MKRMFRGIPVFVIVLGACAIGRVLFVSASSPVQSAENTTATTQPGSSSMVTVRVIDKEGKLTGPVSVPRVELRVAEWQKRLPPDHIG